jgi:hypothetical protein
MQPVDAAIGRGDESVETAGSAVGHGAHGVLPRMV